MRPASLTSAHALLLLAGVSLSPGLWAHGVSTGDAGFLQSQQGLQFWPYFYLGAKHMVTGFDHLLFLAGVVFFLYRLREVATYVTLFAVGHSITLLAGVLLDIPANVYLIDAIIGLSVVYKALDNLGGFQHGPVHINPRAAVAVFGLFHGFGLATKLQELTLSADGLVGNLLAFNLGVEAGQLVALVGIVTVMNLWRRHHQFARHALVANTVIMTCGFVLLGHHLTGYVTT
ncbi:MAG: HupE/UreJ family protein [Pseudomonadota bacterium]